jgi:hypothetical protein
MPCQIGIDNFGTNCVGYAARCLSANLAWTNSKGLGHSSSHSHDVEKVQVTDSRTHYTFVHDSGTGYA